MGRGLLAQWDSRCHVSSRTVCDYTSCGHASEPDCSEPAQWVLVRWGARATPSAARPEACYVGASTAPAPCHGIAARRGFGHSYSLHALPSGACAWSGRNGRRLTCRHCSQNQGGSEICGPCAWEARTCADLVGQTPQTACPKPRAHILSPSWHDCSTGRACERPDPPAHAGVAPSPCLRWGHSRCVAVQQPRGKPEGARGTRVALARTPLAEPAHLFIAFETLGPREPSLAPGNPDFF